MLMDEINVPEWIRAKSPSLARCKEGDLPLLNSSNLTCMLLMDQPGKHKLHKNIEYLLQVEFPQNLFKQFFPTSSTIRSLI